MVGVIDDFELSEEAPAYAQWKAEQADLSITTNKTSHGARSLLITSSNPTITVIGQLPENDLLDFAPKQQLLLAACDFTPCSVSVTINGKETLLYNLGSAIKDGWMQYRYQMPDCSSNSTISTLTLSGTCTGTTSFIDNVYLQ